MDAISALRIDAKNLFFEFIEIYFNEIKSSQDETEESSPASSFAVA